MYYLSNSFNNYNPKLPFQQDTGQVLTGPEESTADVELVVAALTGSGLARDVAALDGGTVQSMQQLSAWATTLALHLLASVPEYRSRRGPGFQLLTGSDALPLLRSDISS